MQVRDKVILVTGSARRVGRTIALELARKKARVVIHYHTSKQQAEQAKAEVQSIGAQSLIVQGDISKRSDWEKIQRRILEHWGRIDVLINNAAIFYRTPLFTITEEDWSQFMNVNLKGTFWGCQVIGQYMYKHNSGKIINIADVSAFTIWTGYLPYCTSKAGVMALTKGMAKALAPHVTVNAIAPGTILLAENYDEKEENDLIKKTPLKRIGDPIDIANTVIFLIEGSDFMTGEIIKLDGGRSLGK